ncbi:hypothetical protein PS023_23675 [Shigella sonnei]|nr:hypothetical protein [Shigella sonnei]
MHTPCSFWIEPFPMQIVVFTNLHLERYVPDVVPFGLQHIWNVPFQMWCRLVCTTS